MSDPDSGACQVQMMILLLPSELAPRPAGPDGRAGATASRAAPIVAEQSAGRLSAGSNHGGVQGDLLVVHNKAAAGTAGLHQGLSSQVMALLRCLVFRTAVDHLCGVSDQLIEVKVNQVLPASAFYDSMNNH